MASIKNTQDDFKIELTLGSDITDDTVIIKYTSPSGDENQWATTTINANKGIVEYINPIGNFLETGIYKIYAHVTRQGGKIIIGDVTSFTVKKEGL